MAEQQERDAADGDAPERVWPADQAEEPRGNGSGTPDDDDDEHLTEEEAAARLPPEVRAEGEAYKRNLRLVHWSLGIWIGLMVLGFVVLEVYRFFGNNYIGSGALTAYWLDMVFGCISVAGSALQLARLVLVGIYRLIKPAKVIGIKRGGAIVRLAFGGLFLWALAGTFPGGTLYAAIQDIPYTAHPLTGTVRVAGMYSEVSEHDTEWGITETTAYYLVYEPDDLPGSERGELYTIEVGEANYNAWSSDFRQFKDSSEARSVPTTEEERAMPIRHVSMLPHTGTLLAFDKE